MTPTVVNFKVKSIEWDHTFEYFLLNMLKYLGFLGMITCILFPQDHFFYINNMWYWKTFNTTYTSFLLLFTVCFTVTSIMKSHYRSDRIEKIVLSHMQVNDHNVDSQQENNGKLWKKITTLRNELHFLKKKLGGGLS